MKHILVLAAALASAPHAQACDLCDEAQAAAAVPATGSTGVSNLTVVRDAETGQLRAPTAAEIAALSAKSASASTSSRGKATAAVAPQVRAYASGAHSARMPQGLASFSVATVRADGTLDRRCVDGEDAAKQAIRQAPAAAAPVKELQ